VAGAGDLAPSNMLQPPAPSPSAHSSPMIILTRHNPAVTITILPLAYVVNRTPQFCLVFESLWYWHQHWHLLRFTFNSKAQTVTNLITTVISPFRRPSNATRCSDNEKSMTVSEEVLHKSRDLETRLTDKTLFVLVGLPFFLSFNDAFSTSDYVSVNDYRVINLKGLPKKRHFQRGTELKVQDTQVRIT
jgi:hypothetical protein